MANGQNVSEFTMTMASVGPATMSSQFDIVADLGKPNYLLSRWLSGKDIEKDTLRGGINLTDTILLNATGNAQWVGANPTVNVTQEQTGSTWSVPWAIALAYMTWNKPTVDAVVGNQGPGGRKEVYKNLMYQLQQTAYWTVLDFMEGAVIANLPYFDVTEASTATDNREPYSLLAGLNEYDITGSTNILYATAPPTGCNVGGLGGNGLVPGVLDRGADPWTTFQQLDPTDSDKLNWRPYQGTYGTYYPDFAGGTDEAAAAQNLWRSLSIACRETSLEQPVMSGNKADPYTEPRVIYCSYAGEAYVEALALAKNDMFRGMGGAMDPDYAGMKFRGIPFQGIKSLGEVAFYLDDDDSTVATTGLTELDTSGGTGSDGTEHTGPRFYGFNGRYANVAFQKQNIFDLGEPVSQAPAGRPFNWVQYVTVYMQLYFRSRRRHFVLRPDGGVNTTAP